MTAQMHPKYHHKHQGLDPLIHSVPRVTAAHANASSVLQFFSFLVVCSGMSSKVFGFGKHDLTRHRSALAANPTSSHPRSWSLGNATLVVADRSGGRRILGASKPRPSAKGAHRYRKRACLEALRLATTKLTQRGTGYPSWGHPTQLRISRGSTVLIHPKYYVHKIKDSAHTFLEIFSFLLQAELWFRSSISRRKYLYSYYPHYYEAYSESKYRFAVKKIE